MTTFESLAAESSSFGLRVHFLGDTGQSSYMKVIGSRSKSQEQKTRNSLLPQCETLMDNIKSGSVDTGG